jgi:uncharacterized SAM-binding protein YcdF (DUF218 family)
MFIYLSKILPEFVYAPGLTIVLLVFAALIRKRRRGLAWLLAVVGVLYLYFMSTWVVAEALERSLESRYPAVDVDGAPKADAIVVLGGYLHIPNARHKSYEFEDAIDRLWMGARLYKAGKAPLILLTGGIVPMYGEGDIPESVTAKQVLQEWGIPAEAVVVEPKSQNTRENATFSAPILASKGAKKLILVTSAEHMPRSVAIFRRAGMDVLPVPTDYYGGWENRETVLRWLPQAVHLYHANQALKEWLGILIYRIRGWA